MSQFEMNEADGGAGSGLEQGSVSSSILLQPGQPNPQKQICLMVPTLLLGIIFQSMLTSWLSASVPHGKDECKMDVLRSIGMNEHGFHLLAAFLLTLLNLFPIGIAFGAGLHSVFRQNLVQFTWYSSLMAFIALTLVSSTSLRWMSSSAEYSTAFQTQLWRTLQQTALLLVQTAFLAYVRKVAQLNQKELRCSTVLWLFVGLGLLLKVVEIYLDVVDASALKVLLCRVVAQVLVMISEWMVLLSIRDLQDCPADFGTFCLA